MAYQYRLRRFALVVALALTSGCALIPDFSSTEMSNSEKADLNLQMGVRYLELGMLEVAKEKLDLAYDLDSSNPEVLNALAVFYERTKNEDTAAKFYHAAVDKDPDNYSYKNNYGRFLCEHGKQEDGLEMLQDAVNSPYNKRPWLAITNVALCHLQRNEADKAEENFRNALQINPEYAPALQEMVKISYNKQEYMSARAFLERLNGVSKETPETLWFGFQIERALGNRKAAEDYKEKLVNSFPSSHEAIEAKSAISK
ncbi:MAG: type IV pilus biogenesis/stability protein PilW [Gammaproteobacteria bacterium]